jgi:hypothetical protein
MAKLEGNKMQKVMEAAEKYIKSWKFLEENCCIQEENNATGLYRFVEVVYFDYEGELHRVTSLEIPTNQSLIDCLEKNFRPVFKGEIIVYIYHNKVDMFLNLELAEVIKKELEKNV